MYIPSTNRVDDEEEIRAFATAVGVAQIVTVGTAGMPAATLLPFQWTGPTLLAHAARRNEQFAGLAGPVRALAVVTGPDAYVSPAWYVGRTLHRRTVPTWDYSTVHLSGTLHTFFDEQRLREHVTALSAAHEEHRADPYTPGETPTQYLAGMIQGIVGLELRVDAVEARAKLSQNRLPTDRASLVEGLRSEGDPGSLAVADQIEAGTWLPGRGDPAAGWTGPRSGPLTGGD